MTPRFRVSAARRENGLDVAAIEEGMDSSLGVQSHPAFSSPFSSPPAIEWPVRHNSTPHDGRCPANLAASLQDVKKRRIHSGPVGACATREAAANIRKTLANTSIFFIVKLLLSKLLFASPQNPSANREFLRSLGDVVWRMASQRPEDQRKLSLVSHFHCRGPDRLGPRLFSVLSEEL